MYGYDDRSIWVVSSQYEDVKGLKLTTKIYNIDMTEKFTRQDSLDAPPDSTAKIFTLPEVQDSAPLISSRRHDHSMVELVGSNFYWLSTKAETIDWAKVILVDDSHRLCLFHRPNATS